MQLTPLSAGFYKKLFVFKILARFTQIKFLQLADSRYFMNFDLHFFVIQIIWILL
jgi:hypothetical protein